MVVSVDSSKKIEINLNPATVEEEVMQNLWVLYSSLEYQVPLDMELGLKTTYIDRPIDVAKALVTADIYEKTEKYEPRAKVVNIRFTEDYEHGILKPIVEVEINDEYDNEEYS